MVAQQRARVDAAFVERFLALLGSGADFTDFLVNLLEVDGHGKIVARFAKSRHLGNFLGDGGVIGGKFNIQKEQQNA